MSLAGPDPSLALQQAVYEALMAAGVCNGAVFSEVPQNQQVPFAQIGDDDFVGELDGGPHTRATVNVNLYASSRRLAKEEAAKAKVALDTELEIDGFYVSEYLFDAMRMMPQPDGETQGCALSFEYLLIPTAA